MRILANGINYSTGEPLISALDEQEFARRIEGSLPQNATRVRVQEQRSSVATTFRGEIERQRTVDRGDPRQAGWTYLIHAADPNRKEIEAALKPLAAHRGMPDSQSPLIFAGEEDWAKWLSETYMSIPLRKRPYYVLIAGSPELIPFRFQAMLDVAGCVGRVDFESVDDLKTYVDKVIRLEEAPAPATTADVLFFATDHGIRIDGSYDATYFSRRYMVEPLVKFVESTGLFNVTAIIGETATKPNLVEALRKSTPALVYTASHGLGAVDEPLAVQKRLNGAICCQRTGKPESYLFSGDDVPVSEPFLEGAVFFQFACFGYGTPAVSEFAHWQLGVPENKLPVSFTAALPKRLLALPRGPIGFIGHVDTAWLHGFDDPNKPVLETGWHPRLQPFIEAVDTLLKVQPPGLAMGDFNTRYNIMNARLTEVLEKKALGIYEDTPATRQKLATDFILRSDAQNYMVFGDPGAQVRISD